MAKKITVAEAKAAKQREYNRAWRAKKRAVTQARITHAEFKLEHAPRLVVSESPATKRDDVAEAVSFLNDGEVIRMLANRKSTLGTLMRAHLLVIKKSEDYNQTGMTDGQEAARANRDNYFPFGMKSYIHMLHTKVQRLISLEAKGGTANFEGMYDTVLDTINYASFMGERIERTMDNAIGVFSPSKAEVLP